MQKLILNAQAHLLEAKDEWITQGKLNWTPEISEIALYRARRREERSARTFPLGSRKT